MKNYKAPDNSKASGFSLHWLSDSDISNGGEMMLPYGYVEISEQEANEISISNQQNQTPKSKQQRIKEILESVGCVNETHLQKDIFIAEAFGQLEGLTPQQIYQTNPGYTSLIDARNAIEAIKAE